jgi:hypothetical protein
MEHRDNEGRSAFYYALRHGLVEIVELLINSGANVKKQTNLALYLFFIKPSTRLSDELYLWNLLIKNGIDLHCSYMGQRVFHLLLRRSGLIEPEKIQIYRNALIKEISDTFKYTDYENFRKQVVESIDDESIILVDSNHLKASELLATYEKDLENELEHLRSIDFKERLIVDYLNVLDELRRLLQIRKVQLADKLDKFTNLEANEAVCLALNEIVSGEAFINNIQNRTSKAFISKISQSIGKYIDIIETKLKIGRGLLELIETKMNF